MGSLQEALVSEHVAMAVLSEAGHLLTRTNAWTRLFPDFNHDALPLGGLLSSGEEEVFREAMAVVRGGLATSIDITHVGQEKTYRIQLSPSSGRGDGHEGCLAVATEISDVTLALREMRDRLSFLEFQAQALSSFGRILQEVPVALWSADGQERFTMAEGSGFRLLGIDASTLVGRPVEDVFAGSSVGEQLRVALSGKHVHGLCTMTQGVSFETWYLPALQQDGSVDGVLAVSVDVTERVQGARALSEQIALLEEKEATIRALATPILRVWEGILCVPVIGKVDRKRAREMMSVVLSAIVGEKARCAILDLTGVDFVDSETAEHLLRIVKAISLIGAESILCGLQPKVAKSLVGLGIEFSAVHTVRTLEQALALCLAGLQVRVETSPES